MTTAECTALLSQYADAIRQLAAETTLKQARWKPDPDSWSILEVVNHLGDEEREDFRARLSYILDQTQPMPAPIHPSAWVIERSYNTRDLQESLDRFLRERKSSLAWLNSLNSPDLGAAIEAPFGRLTAGNMLHSWVAHDLLHLRQLVELRYAYLMQQALPYDIAYAGDW